MHTKDQLENAMQALMNLWAYIVVNPYRVRVTRGNAIYVSGKLRELGFKGVKVHDNLRKGASYDRLEGQEHAS